MVRTGAAIEGVDRNAGAASDRGAGVGATGVLIWATAAWVAGLFVCRWISTQAFVSVGAAAGALAVGVFAAGLGRMGIARRLGLVAVFAAAMLRGEAGFDASGLGADIGSAERLAHIEGVVESEPHIRIRSPGELGGFDYRGPRTTFFVRADRVAGVDGWNACDASLLVLVSEYDDRLRLGDRVRLTGWLSGFSQPLNPGEADFGEAMASRGIAGRLVLESRGNCRIISVARDEAGVGATASRIRSVVTAGFDRHTRAERGTRARALLRVLLLGERTEELEPVDRVFRETGLAHMLAISGLHVGVLLGGVWGLALRATGRPRLAVVLTLAAMAAYLLIVPGRVPIIRAAVMSVLLLSAWTTGRRSALLPTLAAAALVVLVWRPSDLFSPGFQLSFGVVLALILFAERLSERVLPRPLIFDAVTVRWRVAKRAVDIGAVSIVAWCAATPVIAYHFHIVSPWSLVATPLLLPLLAATLWLGYAQVLVGLAWPAAADVVAVPVDWCAGAMVWAADGTAAMPGASIWVSPPSLLWTLGALVVVAAMLSGAFRGRAWAGWACAAIVIGWLHAPVMLQRYEATRAACTIDMFAVGNGSSYLVRVGDETIMYDCGSSSRLDITTAVVGPALRTMGVLRIDTLILSHPDTDHFSGALELIDRFGVARVVTTRLFLDEADRNPEGAAAYLIRGVRSRGVPIEVAHAGWRDASVTGCEIEAIWPPSDRVFESDNDGSLVVSVRAAGRRVLLSGDIQGVAMDEMLRDGLDLTADIVELPHHGSFIPAAPRWVAAAGPSVVLQSTGPQRVGDMRWDAAMQGRERLVTAVEGMAEVVVGRDGAIEVRRYRPMDGDTAVARSARGDL